MLHHVVTFGKLYLWVLRGTFGESIITELLKGLNGP